MSFWISTISILLVFVTIVNQWSQWFSPFLDSTYEYWIVNKRLYDHIPSQHTMSKSDVSSSLQNDIIMTNTEFLYTRLKFEVNYFCLHIILPRLHILVSTHEVVGPFRVRANTDYIYILYIEKRFRIFWELELASNSYDTQCLWEFVYCFIYIYTSDN